MIRIHLIAGKSLELSTTIIRKLDYEGLKTERLDNQQQSTLAYSVDHTVLKSRVNVQRPFPCWGLEIFL